MVTIDSPTYPLLPREYATIDSPGDARALFPGLTGLHRKWGVLMCEDQDGRHWTLLGRHSWVKSLKSQAKPMSPNAMATVPPSPGGIEPSGHGIDMTSGEAVAKEWPLDEFDGQYVIPGWPDEWTGRGRIDVLPFGEYGPFIEQAD